MNQFSWTHILLISFALFFRSALTQESSDQVNEGSNHHHGRHHHRHRQHHSNNNNDDDGMMSIISGSENDEDSTNFIAAYRTTEVPEVQPEDEGDGNGDQSSSSNSLESRLANLEQDVRHLCLEDEEDVERQIRQLGVKCICPKTEAPVCGSDNVTYYNRCYLHCRSQQAEMSYHRYKITLKKFGRC